MSKPYNEKRQKTTRKRRQNPRNPDAMSRQYFVKSGLSVIVPPTKVVNLKYNTSFELGTGLANYVSTYRLLTGLYDPDDGASGNDRNYSGFNELAALYGRYCVETVRYRISISNQQSIPVTFCCVPSIYFLDPQITSGNSIANFEEQPYGRKIQIGGAGGIDTKILRGYIDLGRLHGDMRPYTGDDYYRGTSTSNPLISTYFYMGVFAASNLDQGVVVSLELEAQVYWDNRIINLNGSTVPPPSSDVYIQRRPERVPPRADVGRPVTKKVR